MAMISELHAGFDKMRSLVEKLAESAEKGDDRATFMVCAPSPK